MAVSKQQVFDERRSQRNRDDLSLLEDKIDARLRQDWPCSGGIRVSLGVALTPDECRRLAGRYRDAGHNPFSVLFTLQDGETVALVN